MKKLLTATFFLILVATTTRAQDPAPVDTSWKKNGTFNLNFTQVSFSNWAAGGQNSISGIALIHYVANYKKGKNIWDNTIDLGYGLTQNGSADPIKSEDKIDLSTKLGHQISKYWYYALLISFKSQFTDGFNYPNDSVPISRFLAPAYLMVSAGFDFKPNDNLSVFISPATIRYIIVNDQKLADAGAFGVDKAEYDAFGTRIKAGEKSRLEVGALLKAVYKKDILENVNFSTKLELFANYLDEPQNIDVNWEMLLTMKVNKYLSATVSTQLIYDDNTVISIDNNDDGVIDERGPRTQFKEVLGIGLAYTF